MLTGRTVKTCLIAFVITLVTAVPLMAQDVFEAAPADVLFAVRINNVEFTLGQIDQFLVGLAPAPNMASMMGRMQLANFLGDPNLSGVNMRGQVAVFGTAKQKENAVADVHVAGLLAVTDYAKFAAASKPDANGVSTVGRMGLLAVKSGDYALIGPPNDYAALVAMARTVKAKNLASALSAGQRDVSAKARIWGYGNVQLAQKLYGPMIASKLEEATKSFAVKDANMAAMAQKGMTIYFDILKSLMNQTKDITIGLNPKADSLGLILGFTAIPGSDMAKTLVTPAASSSDMHALLGYLPENSMMSVGWQVNKPFAIQKYTSLIEAAAPALGPKFTAEEKAKAVALVTDTFNSLGKALVYSAGFDPNSKQPFTAQYVCEVADAAAFQKNLDAAREMMNAPYMVDLMKSFGMKISYDCKPNAGQYKGVAIDETTVAIAPVDSNSQMTKMIAKMYGESLTFRKAMVNGLMLCTVGSNADAQLKGLIDTAKSGGPKDINAEIKSAMALVPDSNQAQIFGTYNYMRALQMTAGFMPMMPFDANAVRQIASKSDIAFSGNVGNGDVTLNVVVPKQQILEIKSAFETFKPGQMSQPQSHKPVSKRQGGSVPQ